MVLSRGDLQVAAVMRLTPAYLTSVASFYDMFELHPKHTHDVFVCTNISCSILGADEFYDAMAAAAEGQDIDVHSFECLGACASPRWRRSTVSTSARSSSPTPSASSRTSTPGSPCSATSSCATAPPSTPTWVRPHHPPQHRAELLEPDHPHRADTAGLTEADHAADRPGPSAPLEMPPQDQRETSRSSSTASTSRD